MFKKNFGYKNQKGIRYTFLIWSLNNKNDEDISCDLSRAGLLNVSWYADPRENGYKDQFLG